MNELKVDNFTHKIGAVTKSAECHPEVANYILEEINPTTLLLSCAAQVVLPGDVTQDGVTLGQLDIAI